MDLGVQFNIAGLTSVVGGISSSADGEKKLDLLISKASGKSSSGAASRRAEALSKTFAKPMVDHRCLKELATYEPTYKYKQDELWSSSKRIKDNILLESIDPSSILPIDVSPLMEVHRHKCVQNLRKRLSTMVERLEKPPSFQLFERWQFVEQLLEAKSASMGMGSRLQDPIIPVSTSRDINSGIAEELKECGAKDEMVETVSTNMRKAARKSVQTLHRHEGNGSKNFVSVQKQKPKDTFKSKRKEFGETEEMESGDMYQVSYRNIVLPITAEHLTKLHTLFVRHNKFADFDKQHKGIADARFLQCVFALLLRYQTLQGTYTQGAGFQAAIPGTVFDVFEKHFDCKMECFASPLNCHFERYCSVFPDTDAPFGSIGSFFQFKPSSGAYEANPPFIPELITYMAEYMETLLSETNLPLMFIIIIPMWEERKGWQLLNQSDYRTKHVMIDQKKHGYTEGAQHMRETRYRVASFHTSVFFWQNEAARKKWRITTPIISQLKAAFVSRHRDVKEKNKKQLKKVFKRKDGDVSFSRNKGDSTSNSSSLSRKQQFLNKRKDSPSKGTKSNSFKKKMKKARGHE